MGAFSNTINSPLILTIIGFIIFMIVGAGGGFSALWSVGEILKEIPAWGWIVVALIILLNLMFGGNRR